MTIHPFFIESSYPFTGGCQNIPVKWKKLLNELEVGEADRGKVAMAKK